MYDNARFISHLGPSEVAFKHENWTIIVDLAFLKHRVYANSKVQSLQIQNNEFRVALGLNVHDDLNYLTDIFWSTV